MPAPPVRDAIPAHFRYPCTARRLTRPSSRRTVTRESSASSLGCRRRDATPSCRSSTAMHASCAARRERALIAPPRRRRRLLCAAAAELNRALAVAYELPGVGDADVTKVLVLVPGFLGGANTFDYLARRVVLRTQGRTAVRSEERRV